MGYPKRNVPLGKLLSEAEVSMKEVTAEDCLLKAVPSGFPIRVAINSTQNVFLSFIPLIPQSAEI